MDIFVEIVKFLAYLSIVLSKLTGYSDTLCMKGALFIFFCSWISLIFLSLIKTKKRS